MARLLAAVLGPRKPFDATAATAAKAPTLPAARRKVRRSAARTLGSSTPRGLTGAMVATQASRRRTSRVAIPASAPRIDARAVTGADAWESVQPEKIPTPANTAKTAQPTQRRRAAASPVSAPMPRLMITMPTRRAALSLVPNSLTATPLSVPAARSTNRLATLVTTEGRDGLATADTSSVTASAIPAASTPARAARQRGRSGRVGSFGTAERGRPDVVPLVLVAMRTSVTSRPSRRPVATGRSSPTIGGCPTADPGGRRPSSTRSTRDRSPTPTATASATCRASSSRLDYLAELGADAIWLSPIFPLADGRLRLRRGRLLRRRPAVRHAGRPRPPDRRRARARACRSSSTSSRTTRPTSTRGSWSRAPSRTSPKRDWYVWRDARPDGSPPNNWVSFFGGTGVGVGRGDGPVLPAPVPSQAARPQLAQPRGAGGDVRRDAVLARPRRRRLPHRRPVAPRQAPGLHRQPAGRGHARGRDAEWTRYDRPAFEDRPETHESCARCAP